MKDNLILSAPRRGGSLLKSIGFSKIGMILFDNAFAYAISSSQTLDLCLLD